MKSLLACSQSDLSAVGDAHSDESLFAESASAFLLVS